MQAAEELARGQQQGWAANGAVYEAMVAATCEAGFLDEAIEIVNRMKVCAPPLFMPASSNLSCTVKLVVNTMIRAGWCMPWHRVMSRQQREPCCTCFSPRPSHASVPNFNYDTLQREGVAPTARHVHAFPRKHSNFLEIGHLCSW